MADEILKIGLTGSIGMGKTTTGRLFVEAGGALHDADEAVGRLYAKGGSGVAAIAALAPHAIVDDAVDRGALRAAILTDGALLKHIEAAIHPLVEQDRQNFVSAAEARGGAFVVFDIPLLFETGAEKYCDVVVVVSTSAEEQRQRVLARPGMTEEILSKILARQMPDTEKRARADYVIDTSISIDDASQQVRDVLHDIEQKTGRRLVQDK